MKLTDEMIIDVCKKLVEGSGGKMKLFILALISFTLGFITQSSINKHYDKEKEIKNNKKFESFFVNIPIKALPADLKFKVTPKTSGHYKINCDAELIEIEYETNR